METSRSPGHPMPPQPPPPQPTATSHQPVAPNEMYAHQERVLEQAFKHSAIQFGVALMKIAKKIMVPVPLDVNKMAADGKMADKMADKVFRNVFNMPNQLSNWKMPSQASLKASIDKLLSPTVLQEVQHIFLPGTEKLLPLIKNAMQPKVNPANLDGDEMIPPKPTLKGRNAFAEIHHTFRNSSGVARGSESIKRIPVVEQREQALKAKIEFLENQLEKAVGNTPLILKLNREIGACKADLANCKRSKNSWIGSNASRDALGGRSFDHTRAKIIPGAVNHRSQTVTTNLENGKTVTETFHRFGAVWDPRNGLLNLRELAEILDMRQEGSAEKLALSKKITEGRIAELKAMKSKDKTKDQLALIDESISMLEGLLRPSSSAEFKKSVEFVADRRRFLREQMLSPILGQMKDNGHKLYTDKDGNHTFPMFHLGLLNCEADQDFQASGWAHLEQHQIADMAQIFKELQGCEIVISDQPHSFFGVENDQGKPVLYLSQSDAPQGKDLKPGDKINLSTCFMNITVQKNVKNNGIQEEVNNEQIGILSQWALNIQNPDQREEILTSLATIQARLAAGESNFELATDIAMVAKELAAVSQGCLSCKDRGGTLAETMAINMMQKNLFKDAPPNSSERKKIEEDMNEFVQTIFHKDNPCTKVVEDNTGVVCAKVEYWRVPNLSNINILRNGMLVAWKVLSGGLEVVPEEST